MTSPKQKVKKPARNHPWRVYEQPPKLPPGVKPQHPVPQKHRMGV